MSRVITKKICLIGEFSVGKTSLVRRFVNNQFSDDYLTTVGVSISTRELAVPDGSVVKMIIWDIAGEDHLTSVSKSYLQGADGYLLIADGTRNSTLDAAVELKKEVNQLLGDVPFFALLNKADLVADWEAPVNEENPLYHDLHWTFTSARTGEHVNEIFFALATILATDAGAGE